MSNNRNLADFHQAVADWLRMWDKLESWAAQLGVPAPTLPDGLSRRTPKLPTRKRRSESAKLSHRPRSTQLPPTSPSNGNGVTPQITVPVAEVSRPLLCLAILRREGHPMETGDIIRAALQLGQDWKGVAGGADNAVHGALWRERMHGHVVKEKEGPWRLAEGIDAPILSSDGRTVTLLGKMTGRHTAQFRRDRMLEVFGGRTWRPDALLKRMRKESEFQNMTRASLRDDLEKLIADGRVLKVKFGEYRRTA